MLLKLNKNEISDFHPTFRLELLIYYRSTYIMLLISWNSRNKQIKFPLEIQFLCFQKWPSIVLFQYALEYTIFLSRINLNIYSECRRKYFNNVKYRSLGNHRQHKIWHFRIPISPECHYLQYNKKNHFTWNKIVKIFPYISYLYIF